MLPVAALFFQLLLAAVPSDGTAAVDLDGGLPRKRGSAVVNSGPQGDFEHLVIPVRRVHNLLLVEATVNGQRGNFILDTGAPGLVLNMAYFRGGRRTDGMVSAGITGSASPTFRMTVERLEIRDLFFEGLEADMVQLGHIEDRKGVQILGLIGAGLFAELGLEVDVRNSVIVIHRLDASGNVLPDSSLTQPSFVSPLEVHGSVPFTWVSVRRHRMLFCVDTGAEINALDHAVHRHVLEEFRLQKRTSLGGAGTAQTEVLAGVMNELSLGEHRFLFMQTIVTSLDALQQVYGVPVEGVLGHDLFAEGRVLLNQKKHELCVYLYPEVQP